MTSNMAATRHVFVVSVLLLLPLTASAQVQRSPPAGGTSGGAQSQQLQQLQQQAVAERAQLQSELDKARTENEGLKKQLAALTSGQQALQQKAASLSATAQKSAAATAERDAAAEKQRSQMQELVTRFRETAQNLKTAETDRTGLRAQLAERDASLATCTERNTKLYELNNEVLTHFESQGVWSSLARQEPFTQLARTRLLNLDDDIRNRATDARVP